MNNLSIQPSVYLFGRSAQRDSVNNNDPRYSTTKHVLHTDARGRKFPRCNSCPVMEYGFDRRLYTIEEQSLHKRAESGFAQSVAKRYIDLNTSSGATHAESVQQLKADPKLNPHRLSSFPGVLTIRQKGSIVGPKRKSDSCINSSMFMFPVRNISSHASMPEGFGSQDPDDGPHDPDDGCKMATGSDSDDDFTDYYGSDKYLAMLPRSNSDFNARLRYWLGCKYRFLVISETLEITFLQTGVSATTDKSSKKLYLTVSLLPGKQQKQRLLLYTFDNLSQFPAKTCKFKNFTYLQVKDMTVSVKLAVHNGWFRKSVTVLRWLVPLDKCGILKSKTVWKEVELE